MGMGKIFQSLTTADTTIDYAVKLCVNEENCVLPGTYGVITALLREEKVLDYLYILDDFEITAERIYKMYSFCCNKDFERFKLCLRMIRDGEFDKGSVEANLIADMPLPFIDDSVPIPDDTSESAWLEWCAKQKELFVAARR